jgi:hypothetical protein
MEVRGNEINLFYLYPGLKVRDPALVVCLCPCPCMDVCKISNLVKSIVLQDTA